MYRPKVFRQLNKQFENSTEASLELSKQIRPIINQLVEHIEHEGIIEQCESVHRINTILLEAEKELESLKQTFVREGLPMEVEVEDLFQNCQALVEKLTVEQKQKVIECIDKRQFKIKQEFKPLEFLIEKLKLSRI